MEEVDDVAVKAIAKLAGIPLPQKLTPQKKKKLVDNAVSWLRDNDPANPEEPYDIDLESLLILACISMPSRLGIPQKEKLKATEVWLRNNEPDSDDVDDESLAALTKMAGIALPKKLTPEKKALVDTVEWLRNSDFPM